MAINKGGIEEIKFSRGSRRPLHRHDNRLGGICACDPNNDEGIYTLFLMNFFLNPKWTPVPTNPVQFSGVFLDFLGLFIISHTGSISEGTFNSPSNFLTNSRYVEYIY